VSRGDPFGVVAEGLRLLVEGETCFEHLASRLAEQTAQPFAHPPEREGTLAVTLARVPLDGEMAELLGLVVAADDLGDLGEADPHHRKLLGRGRVALGESQELGPLLMRIDAARAVGGAQRVLVGEAGLATAVEVPGDLGDVVGGAADHRLGDPLVDPFEPARVHRLAQHLGHLPVGPGVAVAAALG
jgi:hypothetical protein